MAKKPRVQKPKPEPKNFREALKRLTAKQRAFVVAYLSSPATRFNATQSAIDAGYSAKTAYSMGEENLRKPEIRRAIDFGLEEAGLSPAQAVARLEEHAKATLEDFITLRPVYSRPMVSMQLWEAKAYVDSQVESLQAAVDALLTASSPDKTDEARIRNDLARFKRYAEFFSQPRMAEGKPRPWFDDELVDVPWFEESRLEPELDFDKARRAGKLHLLRKLEWKQHGPSIELHPVQEAIVKLMHKQGQFTKKVDITSGGAPIKVLEIKDVDV
jgi:phage terminase small subunit